MMRLDRFFRDYRQSGSLASLFNVHGFVDEGDAIFLLKSGGVGRAYRLQGLDAECLDEEQRAEVVRRWHSACRAIGEGFTLQQLLIKDRATVPSPTPHRNPVVEDATDKRLTHLASRPDDLYAFSLYVVLAYEAPPSMRARARRFGSGSPVGRTPDVGASFSGSRTLQVLDSELTAACQTLRERSETWAFQLVDLLQPAALNCLDTLRLFQRLTQPESASAAVPTSLTEPLDYLACLGTVECHRDHLRIDDAHVRVLKLKTPPAQTFAYQLEAIYDIPTSFVFSISWRPASADATRRLLRRQRRHHHQGKISLLTYFQSESPQPHEVLVDDSATAMVQQLGDAATQLDVHGHAFGQCAVSVTLAAPSRRALDRATTLAIKAFSASDMTLLVERYGLLQAWLASFPGGSIYQLRWFWLSDLNHADLSTIFGVASGEWNAHLGADYLALFESNQRTLYRLNLHHQDVGHALILGATGSGKSFLSCYLATHAQRYAASTVIFDLGGSYRRLTDQFGGGYLKMDLANPAATLNPFALPPSPEHLSFLASFVRVLVGDTSLSAYEQGELWDQVQNIYTLAPRLRRLSTLAAMLPRSLEIPLRPWIDGGQYAAAFDHVEDTVTFRDFHTIDFEGLDRHPALLRPIHYYLAYRVSTRLTADPSQWGLWLIDESWKYLPQAWFHQDIREALKTWRRKNVSVVLVTQSADDLTENGMLRLALEACRTRILLANQGFDTAMGVNQFGLSRRACDAVLKLTPRQQLLIQRPEVTKVLNLNVSEAERWLYSLGSSPPNATY